jgi:hypothetical protein
MKVYYVTLELHVYDDVIDPKDWEWHELLDLDGRENVLVKAAYRATKEDELNEISTVPAKSEV